MKKWPIDGPGGGGMGLGMDRVLPPALPCCRVALCGCVKCLFRLVRDLGVATARAEARVKRRCCAVLCAVYSHGAGGGGVPQSAGHRCDQRALVPSSSGIQPRPHRLHGARKPKSECREAQKRPRRSPKETAGKPARQMECPHQHGTAGRTRGGYKYTYRSYIALFPVHHVADWSPKGLWLQIIVSPFL